MTNIPQITVNADDQQRLQNMSRTERNEFLDRMEHAAAKAAHDEKEANFQRMIEQQTAVSLRGNAHYQALVAGQSNAQRASVQNGVYQHEQLNQRGSLITNDFTAPQALVDQLPVTIGGIQLGPKQAREMAERGEINAETYYAAVELALVPYGYGKANRSFR